MGERAGVKLGCHLGTARVGGDGVVSSVRSGSAWRGAVWSVGAEWPERAQDGSSVRLVLVVVGTARQGGVVGDRAGGAGGGRRFGMGWTGLSGWSGRVWIVER